LLLGELLLYLGEFLLDVSGGSGVVRGVELLLFEVFEFELEGGGDCGPVF